MLLPSRRIPISHRRILLATATCWPYTPLSRLSLFERLSDRLFGCLVDRDDLIGADAPESILLMGLVGWLNNILVTMIAHESLQMCGCCAQTSGIPWWTDSVHHQG